MYFSVDRFPTLKYLRLRNGWTHRASFIHRSIRRFNHCQAITHLNQSIFASLFVSMTSMAFSILTYSTLSSCISVHVSSTLCSIPHRIIFYQSLGLSSYPIGSEAL